MVTDVCPQCSAATQGTGDHFDINALSFAQLAPDLNGEIDVNYRLVACTPPSDINVQVDGNDGVGLWLRLVITVSDPSPNSLQLCLAYCMASVLAALWACAVLYFMLCFLAAKPR